MSPLAADSMKSVALQPLIVVVQSASDPEAPALITLLGETGGFSFDFLDEGEWTMDIFQVGSATSCHRAEFHIDGSEPTHKLDVRVQGLER